MPLATRHRNDPGPTLHPLPELFVHPEADPERMAAVQGRDAGEMERRFRAGHRPYVAWVDWEPAAWGWVATREAEIGELDLHFQVPPGERYLWNFVTRPAHRGRGIYPRLVDAIVRAEAAEAERFWIIRAPENHASGAGIRKAGFRLVADLSFQAGGGPAVAAPDGTAHRAAPEETARAARLVGVPAVADRLAPCWRCARAGRLMLCLDGHCTCDYQRPHAGCSHGAGPYEIVDAVPTGSRL